MKKYIILLLSIFIFSVFAGCSAPKADYHPNDAEISIETNSTDPVYIAEAIANKYLSEFKKSTVVKESRLKDYEFISISPVKGTTDKFSYSIFFSVKPTDKNSHWAAGDGEQSGSWIKKKFLVINVEKSGSKYIMTYVGSGI